LFLSGRLDMLPIRLQPDQVEFVLLSFEGPDPYSKAGGLGVRITNLALFLASHGFHTHLIYIGSPDLPGREEQLDGHLQLHRWCQWISRYHPMGVYDGEEGKMADFNKSAPPYIVEQIARPVIDHGRHLVVLAEEWHTAEALIQLSNQLHSAGLRSYSILLWNANNTMGFDRIDWSRLGYVATLTTVSRYMKQIMRTYGLDPLIIPNGIPSGLLQPPPKAAVNRVRESLAGDNEILLFKVGRYDPAKCWISAIEAAAQLKQNGANIRFLCRGGIEEYGGEVLNHARELGLIIKDVVGYPETWAEALEVIDAVGTADVYDLHFSMPQSMLRVFYAAADFVLANSKHEPFGLVGLEAMAAGGVVFTGPTGETYSADGAGAIALDTEQVSELVHEIKNLRDHPEKAQAIRQAARTVASRYTWENVFEILLEKISMAGCHQKVRPLRSVQPDLRKPFRDGVMSTFIEPPCSKKHPELPIPLIKNPLEIPQVLLQP
jgi:glycosyltransferase involved in cell wall biosynthesis